MWLTGSVLAIIRVAKSLRLEDGKLAETEKADLILGDQLAHQNYKLLANRISSFVLPEIESGKDLVARHFLVFGGSQILIHHLCVIPFVQQSQFMEMTNIFMPVFSGVKRTLFELSPKSILRGQSRLDSLSIFSLMLSIGILLDNITLGIGPLRGGNILAWLVIFSLLMIWIQPRSILILLFSLIAQNIYTFEKMPRIPNHILFEFIINSGFILAILLVSLKDFPVVDKKLRSHLYLVFVSLGKTSLIFLYFFLFYIN